jgi:BolA family transcriptional regulator, general stress-responsive regulator
MTVATQIEAKIRHALMVALEPVRLDVVNESHLHAGHRSSPGTGDSHFRVLVISAKFAGLSRVSRQRLVNQALADLIGKPIHALAMETLAPGEAPRT